jgi:hypothetical protein
MARIGKPQNYAETIVDGLLSVDAAREAIGTAGGFMARIADTVTIESPDRTVVERWTCDDKHWKPPAA